MKCKRSKGKILKPAIKGDKGAQIFTLHIRSKISYLHRYCKPFNPIGIGARAKLVYLFKAFHLTNQVSIDI